MDIAESEDINYIPDIVDGVLEKIKQTNKTGCIVGIKTGFHDLDKLTGGWQPGRYYILGARPKMGKTSLFCQIAETAANQKPVIFILEMSKEEHEVAHIRTLRLIQCWSKTDSLHVPIQNDAGSS